jgi:transcriptional regulator with XRE-family HTH domain
MSILEVSVRQLKAGRALLAWSQERLAEASGISIPTVKRLEAEDGELGGRQETASRLIQAMEAAGVEFIPEHGTGAGDGAGVRLRKA